ncbi:C-lysozyme inhibitor [Yersinia entomophaga]|uniref:C-lysozyme inhibitor n=1 Tax=Yersinia entomophaga TaxID=935293 RepID=A0ABM6BQN6_YERET|nr:Ivy family C-type lysozyme inhibitor [Yersinia entomophaga]ANI31859.1 C-lysozyme inhibitor [Yersinia entomophaga]OWF86727.1 C-lysozyme inhibitor [Yersinia entomophaga]
MKKSFIALFLTFSGFATSAYAQDELTYSKLMMNPDIKTEFKKMIGKQKLPKWVTEGGTYSPGYNVEIGGNKYVVMTSCKPHDCASQRIAVLYSPESKRLAGVFSTTDEMETNQKLQWLSIPDELSIDGKTILFAALTGSLDNHPNSFNLK